MKKGKVYIVSFWNSIDILDSIHLLADVGVYWERKYIDCWDTTEMMCQFAKELGLES